MSEVNDTPRGLHRYDVPLGIEIAAAWAWRLIVIAAASLGLLFLMRHYSEVTVPIAVALLVTALTVGMVDRLNRAGLPRAMSAGVVLIGLIAAVSGLLYLIVSQISRQFTDIQDDVLKGLAEIDRWAREGPLQLTEKQIGDGIDNISRKVASTDSLVAYATSFGFTVTHFVTGLFIALFAIFFMLYEGDRIWRWFTQLAPVAARAKMDSSGKAAWSTLTSFVRATVMVALADAIGITAVAYFLGVPLPFAIGVLVFLGAFVPIVGAVVSGMVAVFLALIALGPVHALIMLAGVIVVQQLESHVLQPFLMGRFVAVHPLGIIVAIAAGIITAGVVGALIAVPFAACANAVVRHLADTAQSDIALADAGPQPRTENGTS